MTEFTRLKHIEEAVSRIRKNMRQWGITMSFLANQLGISRQYAWQIVYYRTPISLRKAREVESAVDGIIAQQKHMPTFGDRLRAARISAGLTLKEVARIIGYTWVGIERWEKNICRPKPGVLWHLFSVYGITPEPESMNASADVRSIASAVNSGGKARDGVRGFIQMIPGPRIGMIFPEGSNGAGIPPQSGRKSTDQEYSKAV